ncbi:MAG: type II toxin-antitoxin system RelE/ParE family toxin [Terracidiphilus sp.]|jgi:mRNA interferase RelE/StbE
MTWNLIITGPAQKDFKKLPQRDQGRVKAVLIAMQDDPFQGDLKRLKGKSTAWRRRVGNYRIIYDLYFEERLIVISAIMRRTSTTYE